MSEPLPILDYAAPPRVAAWRTPLAITCATVGGAVAGAILAVSGVAFFPLWFAFTVIGPATTCTIASKRYVLVGVLTATSMMGELLGQLIHNGNFFGSATRGFAILIVVFAAISIVVGGA